MRGNPVATDDQHVLDAGFYQRIFYSAQKREYGFFGDILSNFQPFVTTDDRVPVSSSITFFSYFKGKSEPAFPKGTHCIRIEEKVSDKDVQNFCRRVYTLYAIDRIRLNFPPQ